MAGQIEAGEIKLVSSDGLQNKILSVDLNGNIFSSGQIKETASSTPGYFGSLQSSWAGSTAHPTLYGDSSDRYVMIMNPHIPYTQNGVNGFAGNMTGSTIRMAGNTGATVNWDVGVGTNSVGADTFSIGRGGANLLKIDSSGRVLMPYQPSFRSYCTSYDANGIFINWASANGQGSIYTYYRNVGSHFNTTSGTFTAPLTGRYLITAMYDNSTSIVERNIGHLFYNGTNLGEWVESYGPYDNSNGAVVFYLNVNDTIKFGVNTGLPFGSIVAGIDFLG